MSEKPQITGLENPFNPYTCVIEGDLSRADTVALVQLSRGKRVIEYGLGGSTKLFRKVAKSVKTYETKEIWAERQELDDIHIIEETRDGSSVKGLSEPCDVLFIDGWAILRQYFMTEFWADVKECIILHDTRLVLVARCMEVLFRSYTGIVNNMDYNPYIATLKSIEWNYLESNMCVIWKREFPLIHEDWKLTEAGNNRKGYGAING